ncbi:MAG TPA: hypothetical protein VF186_08815 [Gaiellaceae bacterium]|jgi:hypothetical protein
MRNVHACRGCQREVDDRFRYCPWCAAPQRTKLVEFFAPHPLVAQDAAKALRVSRYFPTEERPAQFRLSIWEGEGAAAAVSLDDAEAARLAGFLAPPARRPLLEQLRESLHL